MKKDLKEDFDVDRIKRASPAVTTRSKVKEANRLQRKSMRGTP